MTMYRIDTIGKIYCAFEKTNFTVAAVPLAPFKGVEILSTASVDWRQSN